MSDENENTGPDPQAATLEAFKRLGVDVDAGGDADPAAFVAQLNAVGDKLEAQEKAIADLTAEVEEHKKAAAKAKAAARASAGVKPAKARSINAKAASEALSPADLLELVRAADTVEIAFSDGAKEITALAPVKIEGDAWRIGVVGLQLALPELMVHGPGADRPGYALAGYGLFLDGELAAYRDRGGPLTIAGGSKHNLAPDIVFAA